MAIANTNDFCGQIENVVASAATTAKPLAENLAIVVEGLLAIPNVHDDWMIDLVTVERGTDGRPRKHCWGCLHIDFFGSYSGPWHKALADGQGLRLNVVEG